jgi:rubredoxin
VTDLDTLILTVADCPSCGYDLAHVEDKPTGLLHFRCAGCQHVWVEDVIEPPCTFCGGVEESVETCPECEARTCVKQGCWTEHHNTCVEARFRAREAS